MPLFKITSDARMKPILAWTRETAGAVVNHYMQDPLLHAWVVREEKPGFLPMPDNRAYDLYFREGMPLAREHVIEALGFRLAFNVHDFAWLELLVEKAKFKNAGAFADDGYFQLYPYDYCLALPVPVMASLRTQLAQQSETLSRWADEDGNAAIERMGDGASARVKEVLGRRLR